MGRWTFFDISKTSQAALETTHTNTQTHNALGTLLTLLKCILYYLVSVSAESVSLVWCISNSCTLIAAWLNETETHLHLHQSRCPVQDPLQTCLSRMPPSADIRTPRPLWQRRAQQHLGSHQSASGEYCFDRYEALFPAVNKGNKDLTLQIRDSNSVLEDGPVNVHFGHIL